MQKRFWLTLYFSAVLVQAASLPFPSGLVPLTSIANETAPDANGNVLVLGYASADLLPTLVALPFPDTPDPTFFSDASIQLAPGQFFSNVYQPSIPQRFGDYSAFSQPLINPLTGKPFPGNLIPTSLLLGANDFYAFEVGPQATATPEPSARNLFFAAGLLAVFGLMVRRRVKA